MGPKKTTKKTATKTIEETYKKLTSVEHILHRPDTYIGDVKIQKELMWIYSEEHDKIIEKEINYVPGLYKIFDEVLVNAGDRVQEDSTCETIKVNIDQDTNTIRVWNNGLGIPVKIHQEHNLYVPSLIFGELLTSSNYDDSVERTTGGRNGFGAKLANIYSTFFSVETIDSEERLKFYQEFKNNLSIKEDCKITKLKSESPKSYTCITFQPDLTRFGLERMTNDIVSLFKKRVYDMAGVYSTVNVWLNDKKIVCSSFKKYIDLYQLKLDVPKPDIDDADNEDTETSKSSTKLDISNNNLNNGYEIIYEETNPRWQVGVIYAPNNDFKQISFVNGICTYHGGTHVNHVVDDIINKIKAQIKKKHKDLVVKPSSIKENMIVFINSIIVNPAFTSQVKETLKTKESDFGSSCELSEKFIKKVFASGIVDQVINLVKLKEQSLLKKSDGKKTSKIQGIPKLEDAEWAGTKKSSQCYLILTEGDSAKALAMAGLSVVGQERFGVFPLKGKLLNVREATPQQITKNEEIMNIKKIIGLQQGKNYEDTSELRYSAIIIMADSDTDGFHIKGLIINFIHYFWPSLIKNNKFIFSIKTPIIKAFKGNKYLEFYNMNEYHLWKEANNVAWRIKYYKGLGTFTKDEAKQFFNDLHNRLLRYLYENNSTEEDSPNLMLDTEAFGKKTTKKTTIKVTGKIDEDDEDDIGVNEDVVRSVTRKYHDDTTEAITLAFEHDRADHRKSWLVTNDKNKIMPELGQDITIPNFINKEMILFSYEDCDRSLACICDGLKPSQRKVLYGAFLKKMFKPELEIRVSQFAAYVSEKTAYHHGEASIIGTIVKMAQDFVGANNINLLFPSGAFGTRLKGGEDHASARYIYTYVTPKITRAIFREYDEPLLKYLEDDGSLVEPEWFMPVIPMVLVNGTKGIGTGFSTTIPKYSPVDIINNILAMIDEREEDIIELKPWYQGFKGTILASNTPGTFLVYGKYQVVDETTVRITELPIGKWSSDYKEFLEDEKTKKNIVDFVPRLTDEQVEISVVFEEEKLQKLISKKELYKKLKLVTRISINNMWLYDSKGIIRKYASPQDILNEFYELRLEMYTKRKNHLMGKLQNELDILQYKMKFIKFVLEGKIVVFRQKKSAIIEKLIEFKFPKLITKKKNKRNEDDDVQEEQVDAEEEINDSSKSYDYITSMPLFSLTEEKIAELQEKLDTKQQELETVESTTEKEQWKIELNEILEILEEFSQDKKERMDLIASGKTPKKTSKRTGKTSKSIKTNEI